ncbi:MAG: hypothetical protein FJY99_13080 [Candidatus Sericytochromatia bacterium]|nr:hypothetical protein [Candidatus Tanganyikabacteria bacterium]
MDPIDALIRALAVREHRETAYRALLQAGARAVPGLARAAANEPEILDSTYSARGVLAVLGSLAILRLSGVWLSGNTEGVRRRRSCARLGAWLSPIIARRSTILIRWSASKPPSRWV